MKKKFSVSLCLCLCLFILAASAAFAEDAQLGYVTDTAGLLSQSALDTLSANAEQISKYYDCGVYIVIVDDYRSYVNGDMGYFSETVYKSYALGEGSGKNGILLSMSMNDRDFDLCAYGDFANYAFTDYGKEYLTSAFLDNFRRDDWEGGFNDYIAGTGWLLEKAKAGEPYDTIVYDGGAAEPKRGIDFMEAIMMILIPTGVGGISVGRMASRMKTAKKQAQAREYVGEGGVKLTASHDQFLNSTETRQVIHRNQRSGGGGHAGGTQVNSGGFSHRGGKF